jgi:hypothetical protein
VMSTFFSVSSSSSALPIPSTNGAQRIIYERHGHPGLLGVQPVGTAEQYGPRYLPYDTITWGSDRTTRNRMQV